MKIVSMVRLVVQVAALAVFIYQMVLACGKYLTFRSTTVEETKNIQDAKLPSIFVCEKEENFSNVKARFQKHGYYWGLRDFLTGVLDNFRYAEVKEYLSWQGYKNLTYENITGQLLPRMKTEALHIFDHNKNVSKEDHKVHTTALNGFCTQIDLNVTHVHSFEMFYVWLLLLPQLQETRKMDMDIIMTYPASSNHYMINPDSVEGDKPVTFLEERNVYSITIEEVYKLEESGECTNYGDAAKFKTYADCVADEHKRLLKPIIGCTPPWTTALDDQDACSGLVTSDVVSFRRKWHELDKRISMSSMVDHSTACLKPCFEVKIKSKFLKAKETKRKSVSLNFKKVVKVTRYVKTYSLIDLIVEIGSCLGLWIGLSALGVFDLVLDTALWLKPRVKW